MDRRLDPSEVAGLIRDADGLHGAPWFSLRHRLFRATWAVAWTLLASWTPPLLHGWRAWLLRLFGARVGRGVRVYASARIWYPPNLELGEQAVIGRRANCYCMAPLRVGAYAVVSQGAHLCCGTHDPDDPGFQLLARPIDIAARAWVAAEAFVGPGVVVAEGAVLGARGVAASNLEAWTIYVGNPARPIRARQKPPGA